MGMCEQNSVSHLTPSINTFLFLGEISLRMHCCCLACFMVASRWWAKVIMADGLITLILDTSLSFPAISMSDQFEADILLSLIQYSSSSPGLLITPHIFMSVGIICLLFRLMPLMKIHNKICPKIESFSTPLIAFCFSF